MRMLLTILGVLIIVIWFQMGYLYGGARMMVIQSIGLAVIVLIGVALYFMIVWAFRWFFRRYTPSGRMTGDRPSRRNMAALMKTDEEKKLEGMDEADLERMIERHPRYALAIEILCERLKGRQQWADYARQMQYMLSIPNDLSIEEVCNRYYELAGIYRDRLNRIDRAEEMIRAIITAYPGHYQATEARQRLAELERWSAGSPCDD